MADEIVNGASVYHMPRLTDEVHPLASQRGGREKRSRTEGEFLSRNRDGKE